MHYIHRSFLGWLVTLFTLAIGSSALAGFMTETVTTGSQGIRTDFSMNLALPTFDKSLGTLTAVSLVLQVDETMSGTITNHANRPENYQVIETSNFTLALYGQQLLTNSLSSQQSYSGLSSQSTTNFGTYHLHGTSSPLNVSSGSLFQAFLSPNGEVDLDLSSLTDTMVIGGGGNASTGIYTTAIGSIGVSFTYIPATSAVPEPSSLAMTAAGIGLVSASLLRRKQSRRDRERVKEPGSAFS